MRLLTCTCAASYRWSCRARCPSFRGSTRCVGTDRSLTSWRSSGRVRRAWAPPARTCRTDTHNDQCHVMTHAHTKYVLLLFNGSWASNTFETCRNINTRRHAIPPVFSSALRTRFTFVTIRLLHVDGCTNLARESKSGFVLSMATLWPLSSALLAHATHFCHVFSTSWRHNKYQHNHTANLCRVTTSH